MGPLSQYQKDEYRYWFLAIWFGSSHLNKPGKLQRFIDKFGIDQIDNLNVIT